MFKKRVGTITDPKTGNIFHIIDGNHVQCTDKSGKDCIFCRKSMAEDFDSFLKSIPYPLPPKDRRYKKAKARKYQGKTVKEICYTCKEIPCFICSRGKCKLWHKAEDLKGQEKGCVYWEEGKCMKWVCEKDIIKKRFS